MSAIIGLCCDSCTLGSRQLIFWLVRCCARARPLLVPSAIIVVIACITAGCPFVDYFPRQPLREVTEAQVLGKWKLSRSAPPFADDAAAEFFAGGECRLHNFSHYDDESSGTFRWRIDVHEVYKVSVLRISGLGTANKPVETTFFFTRRDGKLVLWQYIGDPDSRKYLEYERI